MPVQHMRSPGQAQCASSPNKNQVTSKSPVGDISVVTLIRTDTTLDHSQKAEKVCPFNAFGRYTFDAFTTAERASVTAAMLRVGMYAPIYTGIVIVQWLAREVAWGHGGVDMSGWGEWGGVAAVVAAAARVGAAAAAAVAAAYRRRCRHWCCCVR